MGQAVGRHFPPDRCFGKLPSSAVTLYDPTGEALGIGISRGVATMLGVGEEFHIMAPWGSEQLVREGDMFVSPCPSLDKVYRVARKKFDESYKLDK